MSAVHDSVEDAAREAREHPALDRAARVGMFAYGVMYLVVAWLGAQLALHDPSGSASGKGALHEVAQQPLGALATWLSAGGFAALAIWHVCQAVGGHRTDDGVRRWLARAGSAGRAVVFVVLTMLAVRTVNRSGGGDGGGGGDDARGLTGELMRQPLGPALVVAVGVGVAALGVISVHRGVTDRWRKGLDADGQSGTISGPVALLARTGHVCRGIAFVVLAGLFAWAGITHDPDKSGGLDQAIVRFRDEPYGPWVILVIVAGFACYGAFHMVRAFYLRPS
ncbi:MULTISPECIES: DUF1206 domain-containing protein [unclassified Nocardioides]|uniref:DUF1206 domain-containing protein n=1 Tax=unclassified Nocardioides TaxID=2615069 RepID=UPI0006FF5998|nr:MULTISPECIES: DUF1206 domain-containing protein [unclassified Nocardioides]KRA28153.1 hypothetical protein ASD81_23655 [Nocardioides sp. Root614]KRA86127.1 hypothetical protein ASD84_23895 [Nocardioides sp. Root682]